MVGMALQVQAIVELHQHIGLASAGHAAEHGHVALGHGVVQGLDQEATQGLVTAGHARVIDPGIVLEPLLDNLRAHAATKAVQATLGVGPGKIGPGLQALGLDLPRHQLVAQHHRRLLALLLVAGAHPLAFAVGHQRQVDHPGERPLVKFDRRAGVHHRPVIEKQLAIVGDVISHHDTSTAYVCRSTNWPIGSRVRPCSLAICRNA